RLHRVDVAVADRDGDRAEDDVGSRAGEEQVKAVGGAVHGHLRIKRGRLAGADAGEDAGQVLEAHARVGGDHFHLELLFDLAGLDLHEGLAERLRGQPAGAELVQVPGGAADGPGQIDVV